MKKFNALKIMMFVAATMLAVACGDDKDDFTVIPNSMAGTEWENTIIDEGIEVTYRLNFLDDTKCILIIPGEGETGETMELTYTYSKPKGTLGGFLGSNGSFEVYGTTLVLTFDVSMTFTRIK